MRKVLIDTLKPVPRETPIAIGCCGAFTVEQMLTSLGFKHIISNDVSFYTSFLASYLQDKPFEFHVTPEMAFGFECTGDTEKDLATFLWWTDLVQYADLKHQHHRRLFDYTQKNKDAIIVHYLEQLRKWKPCVSITAYYAKDVFAFCEENVTEDMIFMAFPPTYKGGYEKIYKRIDEDIEWDRPHYNLIDPKQFIENDELLKIFTRQRYVLYFDQQLEKMSLIGKVQGAGHPVYIYSDIPGSTFISKGLNEEIKKYKILPYDYILPDKAKISVIRTKNNIINHYRDLFLKQSIKYGNGEIPMLWFVNDMLFGVSLFNTKTPGGSAFKDDSIFVISEFTVPSQHKRLSKLLLMLLKSKEMKRILERISFRKTDRLATTVFTENESSGKYRGVFEVVKRDKGKIVYDATFEDYTFKGAYSLWCQKHRSVMRTHGNSAGDGECE